MLRKSITVAAIAAGFLAVSQIPTLIEREQRIQRLAEENRKLRQHIEAMNRDDEELRICVKPSKPVEHVFNLEPR